MKTVKDVYVEYKEWPKECEYALLVNDGIVFSDHHHSVSVICTREQYERYKAEQEGKLTPTQLSSVVSQFADKIKDGLLDDKKADWYDYDKGEGIPPNGAECEASNCGNDFIWCKVVFMGNTICLVDHETHNEQHYHLGSVKFRPLDHDKYKVKVAPMDWLVECGLDTEFSDSSDSDWFIGKLTEICNNSPIFKYKDGLATWKHCRPRMNHKHVLDGVQFARIPRCFAIEVLLTFDDSYIVEFTGLKDGYVWEGE